MNFGIFEFGQEAGYVLRRAQQKQMLYVKAKNRGQIICHRGLAECS